MKNAPLLLSGLLALAGVTAQAAELYTPEQYLTPSVSTTTRAEAKQSVLRARATGTPETNETDQPQFVGTQIDKTRAEVRNEYLAARKMKSDPRDRSLYSN